MSARRSRHHAASVVGLGLVLAGLAGASEAGDGLARLAWLAGCWERTSGERTVEEVWMAPRGGAMLGMSRTVVSGTLREYEHTRIEERDGLLVFTAMPSGQPTASFTAIELGADRVVFENREHDFPQRVIYARAADGSLAARIEGTLDGVARAIDFPYRRVACPVGAAP